MKINKYNDKISLAVSILLFFFIIIFYFDYMSLPLTNDEFYYAAPGLFNSLNSWTQISFGHPPGWNFIINVSYAIFGQSPFVAHITTLILNSLLFSLLLFEIAKITSIYAAIIPVLLIFNHAHFSQAIILAFPVIISSLAGALALIKYYNKKYISFVIFITIAILIRESALIFLAAPIFINFMFKKLKYSLIPILSISSFYLWHFIVKEKLLLNHAVNHVSGMGVKAVSFDINKTILFYIEYIAGSLSLEYKLYIPVIIFSLSIIAIFTKNDHRKLITGLLFCFIVHALFFSAYYHWEFRDSFMSSVALFCTLPFILNQLLKVEKVKSISHIVVISISVLLIISYSNANNRTINSADLRLTQYELSKNIEKKFQTSMKDLNNKHISIIIHSEFSQYLKNPYMGHVKEKIKSNFINYDGVLNLNDIHENFYIILFANKYNIIDQMDNTNTLLKQYVESNHFDFIDYITIAKDFSTAYIYKKK